MILSHLFTEVSDLSLFDVMLLYFIELDLTVSPGKITEYVILNLSLKSAACI